MRWLPLIVVAACTHPKTATAPANTAPPPPVAPAPPPAPKGMIRLFSDAEIDAAANAVLARVAENAKRSCPAPRMLGEPTPGSSTADLLALFEAQGPLADCLGRVGKLRRDDFVNHTPEARSADKDCAEPIAAAVHKAAAYAEGCSPFQVGVHADPKEMFVPLMIAHLLATRAATAAKPAAAIDMLVDVLRIAQDLWRGHVSLISSMIAVASSEIAGEALDALLDTAKLKPAQLDNLAGALDRLIAAVPSFHEVMEGEREAMALYTLGMIEPPDWVPPGGLGDTRAQRGDGKEADPRDEGAALLFAMEITAEDRAKACPANANLDVCDRGFGAMPKHDGEGDLAALWKELQQQTDPAAARQRLRTAIIETLAGIATPNMSVYVVKIASNIQRLAELRLHVEMLRTHKCPPAVPAPVALGKPLDVHAANRVVTVEKWQIKCK